MRASGSRDRDADVSSGARGLVPVLLVLVVLLAAALGHGRVDSPLSSAGERRLVRRHVGQHRALVRGGSVRHAGPVTDAAELPPGVLARRFGAQLLLDEKLHDPIDVVGRITAVQAQDARGSLLAVRARSRGLTAADVDRCLTAERSLVVGWLNRGTLHLVRSEDHAWLHALTAPRQQAANARRLAQEGVSPDAGERGVLVVERELSRHGPRTRAQLRAALDSADVPTARQAFVHVLGAASIRGVCVRGPVVDGERAFVHVEDWLGPQPMVDRDVALRELALRYLTGHGPATDADLAYWSGLPLRDARDGLRASGAVELVPGTGLLVPAGRQAPRPAREAPTPTLLGMFDPLLHGWPSRAPVLGRHDSTDVVTSNGMFRATALVDGRAVATWTMPSGRVQLAPLPGETVAPSAEDALAVEAEDVVRFLGHEPD